MRHVGHVTRAIAAPGPPWDRIVALAAGAQPGSEQQIPELLLGPARGLVLPSWSSAAGFEIILIQRWWSCTQHFAPRRKFEAWDSGHLSGNISCSSQTQTLRFSLQLHDQTSCHVWVAGKHHREAVCPAAPMSGGLGSLLHCATPTLPWTKAMWPMPSYLLHTGRRPRPGCVRGNATTHDRWFGRTGRLRQASQLAEGSWLVQQHNATGSATHIADPGPTESGLATVGASKSPSPETSERTQGDPKESRGLSILVGREGDPNLSTPQHWGPTPSQSSRAHHRWEVVFRPGSRSSSCRRECGSGHGSTTRYPTQKGLRRTF